MNTQPRTRAEARAMRRARASRILTPAFRKWAYGLTAAAIVAAAALGWIPAPTAATIIPLAMALFYVDENGDAR